MWIEIASNTWAEAKDEQDAKRIKEKYKDYKHIIFGHSMGSFIVKHIVYSNLREFDGVILSGTNHPPKSAINFSLMLNGIGRKHKVHKFNEGLSYGYLSISSKMHGYGKN